jgi:protein SCO1/2
MSGEPGRDYRVVTVSFDETETPEQAREDKAIAMSILGSGFPPEAWRFLTGDSPEIRRLTDAVGFRFQRRGDDFDHPLGLVVLSPAGKVVRYMRGAEFLAADLRLALMEASEGRIGATVGKVLRYCLTYDPRSKRLALDIVKVGGAVTLMTAAALAVFVAAGARRRRQREVQR